MMASAAAERLLARLDGVKPIGPDKWRALCPCHDDSRPSLDITEVDGRVLVVCRVCEATGANVCEAMHVPVGILFNDYDESKKHRPKQPKPRPPTVRDALVSAADAGPETFDGALKYMCDAALEPGLRLLAIAVLREVARDLGAAPPERFPACRAGRPSRQGRRRGEGMGAGGRADVPPLVRRRRR